LLFIADAPVIALVKVAEDNAGLIPELAFTTGVWT
jgi:hypothetical protein